ncbi:MAG: VOC family protein [Allosphingosinicella sp.]
MADSAGSTTLIPHLVCAGAAKAIDFYKAAFGAEEVMRMPAPDGRLMHATVSIEGSRVMLVDEMKEHDMLAPDSLGGTPVMLHLIVADADAAIERAQAAGAVVTLAAHDAFWGDRYGQVRDPFGHKWSIAHPLRQGAMSDNDLREAAKNAQCAADSPVRAV